MRSTACQVNLGTEGAALTFLANTSGSTVKKCARDKATNTPGDIEKDAANTLKQQEKARKTKETKAKKAAARAEGEQGGVRLRSFQIHLLPSKEQKRTLNKVIGYVRYTYNKALRLSLDEKERGGAWRSAEFRARLKNTVVMDPEEPWLKAVPVYPREGELNDL